MIIYFELGQTFSLSEDAAVGDSAGTITAFTSNGTDITFAEADSSSDAFDVSDTGEITLAAGVSLDFETRDEYIIAVVATATDAPPANFSVRIAVVDVEEPPLQDGTAANPYLVDTLAELQSIGSGFSSDDEGVVDPADATASLDSHYRQTADIDASPTASGTWQMSVDDGGTPSDTSDDVTLHGFLPIGNCGADNICASDGDDSDAAGDESADNASFEGSFDGGGYLISGLFIDRSSTRGVSLFATTGSGSVLENIALVGANVTGNNTTGTLVGYAQGTVRQSWASGRLKANQVGGGLVGQSDGQLEGSFAVVTVMGSSDSGGAIGILGGSARRSFALGSAQATSIGGGLIGTLSFGTVSHSFATGDITGGSSGGLVGASSGQTSDSYATGSAEDGGLVGAGSASRSYRVGAGGAGTEITLANLHALACADAAFEDDDGNTCDASNEDVFPWDFGTSADLPVINGLVGGLDAEGQRLAVEFSRVDRTLTGTANVEKTIFVPSIPRREAGSTLTYHWVFDNSANLIATSELDGLAVLVTATTAASYSLHLTIIERDAAGTILAVYADEFSLTVN